MSENVKSVYAVEAGQEAIKVGISNNPDSRVEQIQTGQHQNVSLLHTYTPNQDGEISAVDIESYLHDMLHNHHMNGEWFEYDCINQVNAFFAGLRYSNTDPDANSRRKILYKIEDRLIESNLTEGYKIKDFRKTPELGHRGNIIKIIAQVVGVDVDICKACECCKRLHLTSNEVCCRCGSGRDE